MSDNPYSSPDEDTVDSDVAVFSPLAVAIHGTFFTPFFGAAVAALNWVAVGQHRRGVQTLAIGAFVTFFSAIVSVAFPPAFFGFSLLFAVVLYWEQSMLRSQWPELATAGVASNLALAACFFVAVFTVPLMIWLLIAAI